MPDVMLEVRSSADIPVVARAGVRYRRHLGELSSRGEPLASRDEGFGALRVFDDVVVSAGGDVPIQAHDGFEAVVYVLEGECIIEQTGGPATPLARNGGAYVRLGHGVQHHVRNRSASAPLHLFLAVMVAPLAQPSPRFVVGSFAREASDLLWLASDDPADHQGGSLLLGSPVRLGIATLDPGLEIQFSRAPQRGLYVDVLEGTIEFGSGFVEQGGDARRSLDSPARIQGVTRACVVVADVALGFVQRLV
jgi:quercetin 2,3-dioxygenase